MINEDKNKSEIEEAFDQVLNAKEGEVLIIPCSSFKEAERVRVKLYTEKNRLKRAYGKMADLVDISRESGQNETYNVILTRVSKTSISKAVFISSDGKVQSFQELLTDGSHKELKVSKEPEEVERIRELLKKRGLASEELDKEVNIYIERNKSLQISETAGDVERRIILMRKDGMSEEEITDLIAEEGEASFNKAATKAEEAQGVIPSDEDDQEGKGDL